VLSAEERLKVVVGLGNPGSQYAGTRHNVGWLVMDRIAERAGWTGKGRQRDASNVAMGRFRGLDLTLVKPLTYMNDSGLAVRKVLAREHAPLVDLLVVADDFALPFGKLRFREGGGPGGHNGLRSIIDELGTEKFSRLRVGIGAPERGFKDHVLNGFEPAERQRLDELLDAVADAVEEWARHGTSKAANRFNMFELRPADTSLLAAPGEVDFVPRQIGDFSASPSGVIGEIEDVLEAGRKVRSDLQILAMLEEALSRRVLPEPLRKPRHVIQLSQLNRQPEHAGQS
jgi:PTH1 family peptidyl-tRNA hydrolase